MLLNNENRQMSFLKFQDQLPPVLDGNDFLNYNNMSVIINFSCCMFRREGLNDLPDILFSKHRFSEITLAMYLEKNGFIGYLNEVLSVYRKHTNGTWSGQTDEQKTIDALKTRMIAKEVCADKYKDKIQRLIDTIYIPKLLDNKVKPNSLYLNKALQAEQLKSESLDKALKTEQLKSENLDKALKEEQLKSKNLKAKCDDTEKAAYLKIYQKSRIDIKNFGGKNHAVSMISNSDRAVQVQTPGWFKNDQGTGLVIQSTKGIMETEIQCIGNGELTIWLRGMDCRNENNIRIPVWINYTCLLVNNMRILNEPKLVWHDRPFVYKLRVTDGEIIKIHAEWQSSQDMIASEREAYLQERETLLKENSELQQEVLKAQRSCKKLSQELKRVKQFRSYKIGRI